jgi:hypothetical protein
MLAETGRWLSKDPIGINGGLNQYVFCGNNPVMFGDPTGEKRWQLDYWADKSLDGNWAQKTGCCIMGTLVAAVPDALVIDGRVAGAFVFGAEAGGGLIINLHDFSISPYNTVGIGFGKQAPGLSGTAGLAWNFDIVSPSNKDYDGKFDEWSVSGACRTGSVYSDDNGWRGFSYGYATPGAGAMYSKVDYDIDNPIFDGFDDSFKDDYECE